MRVAARLLPIALAALIGGGCGPAVDAKTLRWLASADEREELVKLDQVEQRLGPGRPYDPRKAGAVPLPAGWLDHPDVVWKLWGDESGDFILAGFNEKEWLYRATGKASR